MARPIRIEFEGAFYHVTARGNERKRIFYSKIDYNKFRQYLLNAQEKFGYLLHCYVLMTNHYHLLIETPQANLNRVMHYINSSYTAYFNAKRKRSGHLFQGRYKAIVIDQDSYLLELSRYMHLNPVRAKMVEKPEDYPHSSYTGYITPKEIELVKRHLVLGTLSKKKSMAIKQYRIFVENGIGRAVKSPLEHVYAGLILGRETFIRNMLNKIQESELLDNEISNRRMLAALYDADEIIEGICKALKIRKEEILEGNQKKYRDIAIYFLKKHTGLKNREIGKLFSNLSSVGVAKAYQRYGAKIKTDSEIKQQINKILSYVKA